MSLHLRLVKKMPVDVYSANITSNLVPMAKEAGLYACLWYPTGGRAGEMIAPLLAGLDFLLRDPERFRRLNPDNGWGSYEGFVQFVQDLLDACELNRDSAVEAWS